MAPAPLTLGTAGHIDHGKTALIRQLTGVDTDRLPQERRRGISIELGYAQLELPSGQRLSVVDVPGHERFVRTMVAGATGIDLFLMAIAADDGVMPQTREHAAVLAALEVRRGVVAITKCDLADPAAAMLEAQELLPGIEAVMVSARTGAGVADLLAALERVAAATPGRIALTAKTPARLNVDRVFTIRGAGTVATGTLWSRAITRGDEVELLPQGLRTRVRGVQVHDRQVQSAQAGQRVALNLTGMAVADVSRGDVIVSTGSGLTPTYRVDCRLEFPQREPAHGERVQVHHGTRESPARLAWLGGHFWQLRLEQPLVAAAGDRLVVRQIAPPDTLGGGVVLDPSPRKHGPSRKLLGRLAALSRGEAPPDTDDRGHEHPGDRAGREPAPVANPAPSKSELALERRLRESQLEPPLDSELDPGDLSALRAAGRAVRVSQTLHYHPEALAEVRMRVREIAARSDGRVTLAQLRDELGTSRKFAQALLAYLDAERVTIRRGDAHYLRKASSSPSAD
ncbi:MAG: selenocysteine-specific elongation factor [Solirubrobacteraceae bacterium]|jgi:selenocysteine-specific elongation factor|nr:selenocysteine-specific elongation factor [Solirubrobacteraceae bacterium]